LSQIENDASIGIGSALIDPDAEPRNEALPSVSARNEERFFAEAKNEHELKMAKHKSGWLGSMFGSSSEAPTNIAGFLIVCCVIVIICCIFADSSDAVDEIRKWALGLITLIVGYLFGAKSKSD